ncbi:CorA family divalent cation transporter [Terasakiella sp. A23]|uniref:CorA family divalent cation transporter n=1 Tax=Terasakiella sp. FCG-A23 TaxID=3080561 RepID=UPI00295501BD|nr:CorA family divalent cation transporter [Terasakiella sp. A23]MDV7339601.1 CorA family divalent cation transporter [Terasakiella sp. A23]
MSDFAYAISPTGASRQLIFDDIDVAAHAGEILWIDLDPQDKANTSRILEQLKPDLSVTEALGQSSQRPRIDVFDDHVYVSLRDVNLTKSATPEDMVNLRAVLFHNTLVTFHTREMKSATRLRSDVSKGIKGTTVSGLLARLIKHMNDQLSKEVEELAEEITGIEEVSVSGDIQAQQEQLSELRRTLIGFQKYLIPQSSVLQELWEANVKWLKKKERSLLKNQAERISSMVGELEHLRQRASVLQEEIKSAHSEQMNSSMFRLTLVATILLPLSLFAGLMGANVGGMPFANSQYGFLFICLMSVGVGAITFGIMKLLKWI